MAQRAVPMAVYFVIGTQTFTRKFRRRFICLQSASRRFPRGKSNGANVDRNRHTCFGVRVEIEAEEAAIMVFCPEEYAASTTLRRELKELAEGHGLTLFWTATSCEMTGIRWILSIG
jgi:hypothetical protein